MPVVEYGLRGYNARGDITLNTHHFLGALFGDISNIYAKQGTGTGTGLGEGDIISIADTGILRKFSYEILQIKCVEDAEHILELAR